MTKPIDWDDLKFVLAVAEAGSANGAARRLQVNHATVLRHIAHLEKGLGLAVLPRFVGSTMPNLVRGGNPLAEIESSLWVMSPQSLAGSGRVQAFIDHLTPALMTRAALLEGGE